MRPELSYVRGLRVWYVLDEFSKVDYVSRICKIPHLKYFHDR